MALPAFIMRLLGFDYPGAVTIGANEATSVTTGNTTTTAAVQTTCEQSGSITNTIGPVQTAQQVSPGTGPTGTQSDATLSTRTTFCSTTGAVAATADTIAVPAGKVVTLGVTAIGRISGGTNMIQLVQNVAYENNAGTVAAASSQGTLTIVPHDVALAAATLAFTISGTNVEVQPTGVAATTIDWTVSTVVRTV
jgi:hypothetical protein